MAADCDRARGPFGESFRVDAEAAVEAGAEILPGNRYGQFHHLPGIEMLAQAIEQLLRDFSRRARQRRGIAQDPLFQFGEGGAVLKVGQMGKLLLTDALSSAYGRVEVHSERAANEHGRLETGQQLQLGWHGTRGL